MKRWVAAILIASCGAAPAQELSEPQQDRFRGLAEQLRCLVCQNQTIADSNAPLAEDLRSQVRLQIAAGKSDAEILDYVTARYGDFVLYRPRFRSSTALLWLAPALLVIGGIVIALRLAARRRVPKAAVAVDPAALQRLLDEDSRR